MRIDSALILSLALLAVSCNFRPLQDPTNLSYVRVYLDDNMLNVTTGFYDDSIRVRTGGAVDMHLVRPDYMRPEILRIGLFDSASGELVSERYLRNQGDDALGHYFDGHIIINPGSYNLVAYNFGTETTIVEEQNNCFGMLATTNEIPYSLKSYLKSRNKAESNAPNAVELIRYDADPLFVAGARNLKVSVHQAVDTLRSSSGEPWVRAESLVKSYYLQIGVIGAQYISSSSCLLTGMASSTHTLDPDYESSPQTTLYFTMHQGVWPEGYREGHQEFHCIYSTFGTFGHLPQANQNLQISLDFVTTYGTQIDTTFNISAEFLKERAVKQQWILPDFEVIIPEPPSNPDGGGGMLPSVEDWGEVHSDFEI